ncbi:MAG: L,D-transpeptidase family protein [Candidatus Pacebacteria bacterium]|nr:L,D-transpeptidase family protein [Candidatus Paceibacterota bacterium]
MPETPKKEKSEEDKDIEITRRQFGLSAAGAVLGMTGLSKDAIAEENERVPIFSEVTPDAINEKEGEWVSVEKLMSQEVPAPDGVKLLGGDRGLVISKSFHRFWLFDKGLVLKTGPTGTARTQDGYDTNVGEFTVTRKEDQNYMSGQYPDTDGEPNMPWAVFFNRGIAFHGSKNFHEIDGKLFLHLDNSHGCANATYDDALLSNETLKIGDPVVVLP